MRPPEDRSGGGLSDYIVGAVMGDGLIGSRLAGRYRLSGHPVALEEIPHELLNRPDFVQRLAAAGERAAILEHPNCVAVYDLVRGHGRLYLVSELVRGRSLSALLGSETILPPATALLIADSVLAALEAAHGRGIVHGDVCPDVITVTQSGEVRVGGFAIAEVLAADPRMLGWPAVEPPEDAAPSVAADLYAVAALVREMLTGARAGEAAGPVTPEAVDAVLARALDPDPTHRFSSAAEFRERLDRAATEALGEDWRGHGDLAERVSRPMASLPRPRARPLGDGVGANLTTPTPPPMPPAPARPRARPRPAPMKMERRRGSRRLAALLVVAALLAGGVLAFIVTNPLASSPANTAPLHVSNVKLSVTPAQGGCDTTFTFKATGTVSGVGTLTYRWEPADTAASPDFHVQITSNEGSFNFTWGLRIQASQHPQGGMTFRVISPQALTATQTVIYSCSG